MPLDYGKFDNIADSDDEKPDPTRLEYERQRKEASEQLQRKMAEGNAEEERLNKKMEAEKPEHQKDRFAYSEGDCKKVAEDLLRSCVTKTPSIKVANGVVQITGVEKLEGEAIMFQVRGQQRITWDYSFKLKWTYQWMGSNFDEGAKRAEGQVVILDFTDATTLSSEKSPPGLKKLWTDKADLSPARQKEVADSLGGKPWPPVEGTLMYGLVKTLEVFAEELPKVVRKAVIKTREEREEWAKEDAEEFEAGGGVKIEEVSSS